MADGEHATSGGALRERRGALVREHMEAEDRHDFDTTIETFARPRCEIIATGEVFDGAQEVRRYFAETRTAFPINATSSSRCVTSTMAWSWSSTSWARTWARCERSRRRAGASAAA